MHYEVHFVGDSELPEGVDYAFATTANQTYLFMKWSAANADEPGCCDALSRSFTTWERAQSVELKEPARAL
jgi:hypothetical protein